VEAAAIMAEEDAAAAADADINRVPPEKNFFN
jgi:hypothetical protein